MKSKLEYVFLFCDIKAYFQSVSACLLATRLESRPVPSGCHDFEYWDNLGGVKKPQKQNTKSQEKQANSEPCYISIPSSPHKPAMSVFSRIKTIGEADLSAALGPNIFRTDDLAQYGFSAKPVAVAFDPVQSLIAVSTVSGHIHVFGQDNVEVVLQIKQPLPINTLRILKSVYLVAIDSRNVITVFNMESREEISSHALYGKVSSVTSDPSMDWLFVGLDNGQVLVYDVDRGSMANFRIDNLQKSLYPRLRMSPAIDVALHPRNPSLLLVCYIETAIVFNMVTQEIVFGLRYELPSHAPGGDTDPGVVSQFRNPPLLRALWHPHGHHILTVHVDGSLVFWDATEGVLILARTIMRTNVNVPVSPNVVQDVCTGAAVRPITSISWNSAQNPEDTSLLIVGGLEEGAEADCITMLDFGVTPVVAMTPYNAMAAHYSQPKRQKFIPIPPGSFVVDVTMLPKLSPYYNGCANPFAFLATLGSSELLPVTYPDGLPMSQLGALPPAFSWVQSYVTTLAMSQVPRNQWLGMLTAVPDCEPFFSGGAPAKRHLRNFETRNALCTGHANGMVRLWDASHGEIGTNKVIELDLHEAVKRQNDVSIKHISFAGAAAELAVALDSGEVVLYKFGSAKKLDLSNYMENLAVSDQQLVDIRGRTSLKRDGFLPTSLIQCEKTDKVTCVNNSNIGFVAVGYSSGLLSVLDRRGPAIIFNVQLSQLAAKKSGFLRKGSAAPTTSEYPTCLEFGIYALGEDKYSSIVLSVGTSLGNVFTFKVVPNPNGTYSVQSEGSINVAETSVISVIPVNMNKGTSAMAQLSEMSQLAQGILIQGCLLAVAKTEIRVLKQPKSKLTHRNDISPIASAGVSFMREKDSCVLTCVTEKCKLAYYAIPSLREISKVPLPFSIDEPQYLSTSLIMTNGDAIIRKNQTSAGLINIWGRGIRLEDINSDLLYDALKVIPPRPTISTMQWIKGTKVTTVDDIDQIIGGPHRPKSKFMVEQEQAAYEQKKLLEQKARSDARRAQNRSEQNGAGEGGGGAFQSIGKAFESLEEGTNEYLKSLTDVVEDGKSSMFKSAFKAKFF